MDYYDESYFTLTNIEINGNDIFYSSNAELTPSKVKYKTKDKFEDKLLVYVIISPLGKASQFLNDQTIKCVSRSENPPHSPEIRCIKDFWGLIKGEQRRLESRKLGSFTN